LSTQPALDQEDEMLAVVFDYFARFCALADSSGDDEFDIRDSLAS
jgi:hypothetical protein